MKKISIFLLVFAIAPFVYAGDICVGVGGSRDTLECAEHKLLEAELALKQAYEQALVRIDSHADRKVRREGLKSSLKQAGEAWLAWRKAQCNFEGESTLSESNWPAAHSAICEVKLTQQRSEYLNSIFAGQ